MATAIKLEDVRLILFLEISEISMYKKAKWTEENSNAAVKLLREGWARVECSKRENINFARLKKFFLNVISHLDGKIY